eukprot:2087726-Pleurochrysis_carterae.AAC.1
MLSREWKRLKYARECENRMKNCRRRTYIHEESSENLLSPRQANANRSRCKESRGEKVKGRKGGCEFVSE